MKVKFKYRESHSGKFRFEHFICEDDLSVEQIEKLKSDHKRYYEMISSLSLEELLENF